MQFTCRGRQKNTGVIRYCNLGKWVYFLIYCRLNLQQVGEHLPAVEVQEGEPGNKVAMDQLFKGKKGVLFAVPGAFTPGCSKVESTLSSSFGCVLCTIIFASADVCISLVCFQTHLPGFVQQAEDLRSKGVQEVACISVNDAFVMAAWGKEHGTDGKVWKFCDNLHQVKL